MPPRKKKERSSTPDADQVPVMVLESDPVFAREREELDMLAELTRPENFRAREDGSKYGEEVTALALVKSDKFSPARVREKAATIREAIVWNPKGTLGIPIGSGSHSTKLALEDQGWVRVGADTIVGLGSVNLQSVQKLALGYYLHHPIARNIINTYTFLTIGEGVTVTWTDRNGKPSERLQTAWTKIARKTKFSRYTRRLVRNTFLFGECFTALYPFTDGGGSGGEKEQIRMIEPDRVERIFYSADDIEDVKGYEVRVSGNRKEIYRPEDVVHSRIGEIGNIPRGIPILLPVLTTLRYWLAFVENRHWINMIRARLPVVREVSGTGAQIRAEVSRNSSLPKPGTVATDPPGYVWKFPSHNIGASDAADDGRLVGLAIAAGVSLPEFLVLADASNSNYSSALVAESPTVRMFLDYQDIFRQDITSIITALTGFEDQFTVEFPPVIRRGVGELAAALATFVDRRIFSRQTACEMAGKKWTGPGGEAKRIANEEAEGEFAVGLEDPPGGTQELPEPFGKVEDGGNGEPKAGASLGATASSKAAKDRETA